MSNIHGLGPVKKGDAKKDQEEFSGGGHTSSTATYRPTATGNRPGGGAADEKDAMAAIIQAAKGQKNTNVAEDKNLGLITIYKNGFIIGSGEFRDAADAKNASFIQDLKKGEVPRELEAACRSEWGDVDAVRVNLVDKTSEVFVPPKPKFDFSQSKGQSLASTSSPAATASFSSARAQRVTVDASQPTTAIQIVTASRQKLKETFNHTHTVLQLYQHIMAATNASTPNFELVAGYPPKPLTNPSATIKDAGLVGSSIQQRIV